MDNILTYMRGWDMSHFVYPIVVFLRWDMSDFVSPIAVFLSVFLALTILLLKE